ncbi:MAG: hypothetical protein HC822_04160 [Oscillochloris sp.]|nr:hypothetical protein [Oscillochloris sp.]
MSSTTQTIHAQPAVGFSLAANLSLSDWERWDAAHRKALRHFPWLQVHEVVIGATTLCLWSHYDPQESLYRMPDGSVLVFVGSPLNQVRWSSVAEQLARAATPTDFRLPWEGRVVLIQIAADGRSWEIWNDWAGTIPLFYTTAPEIGLVSSLEPVTVATANLGPEHFSRRGLVEVLMFGQFLGSDTLYRPMTVLPPDSYGRWEQGHVQQQVKLWSLRAPEIERGRDEQKLIADWYELLVAAIGGSLTNVSGDIALPISSGMDSRLIAAVAADLGLPMQAYTYGPLSSMEVTLGRRVAETLHIPWQRVELGQNYLATGMEQWLDWFGASFHAHGMYQLPFLQRLAGRRMLIPGGYMGNSTGGGGHPSDAMLDPSKSMIERYTKYGIYWSVEALRNLLDFDPHPYLAEINDNLQTQIDSMPGWDIYQQMVMIHVWNRLHRGISYQPIMNGYHGLDRTPFIDRSYAEFGLGLPPELIRNRGLQIKLLQRYWPKLAAFPSPPYLQPLRGLKLRWHALRFHAQRRLPPHYRALLGATRLNTLDLDAVQTHKWRSLGPLRSDLPDHGPLRMAPVRMAAAEAFGGDPAAVRRLLAVVPISTRVLAQPVASLTE